MSSIDIVGAVDVGASSESSWDGSDSELEVEVTQVVQQLIATKQCNRNSATATALRRRPFSSTTGQLDKNFLSKKSMVCRFVLYCCTAVGVFPLCV